MSKRDRLQQKLQEASERWERLSIRVGKLRLARETETRIEERLRLDLLLEQEDAARTAAGRELDTLEAELASLPSASAPAQAAPGGTLAPPLLFWSAALADEPLRVALVHSVLALPGGNRLQQGIERAASLGTEPRRQVREQLALARIIVLLVSADYLADDILYQDELLPAIERHDSGSAIVVPVLLGPCLLAETPLSRLQVLPQSGTPISVWPVPELALQEVAQRIHEVALGLLEKQR